MFSDIEKKANVAIVTALLENDDNDYGILPQIPWILSVKVLCFASYFFISSSRSDLVLQKFFLSKNIFTY